MYGAKKYILDTSFLYSLMVSEDVNHKKAEKIFLGLGHENYFIIPYIVAAEILVAEDKEIDLYRACKEITPDFTKNTENDLDFILTLPVKIRKQLKANDCLILAISKRFNTELLTFDKKLDKIARSL